MTGSIGGTANLVEFHLPGGTNIWDVDYLGNVVNAGYLTVNDSTYLRALGADHVPLSVTGYTGGTADLLDVYSQAGGIKEFSVNRNYTISQTLYGFIAKNSTEGTTGFSASSLASTYSSASAYVTPGTATASGLNLYAVYNSNPYIIVTTPGPTYYYGATNPGCARFIGGVCVLGSTSPYNVQGYNFTPYSCNTSTSVCTPGGTSSGTLSSGTHTLTFTPCPVGAASFVPASPHAFWYYVSGGSGTAEAVSISATTCTSGASTGTMSFSTAYSHSGAFGVGSATAGAQEAAIAAGATNAGNPLGPIYFPTGFYQFYAPVYLDNGGAIFGDGPTASVIAGMSVARGLFDVDTVGVDMYNLYLETLYGTPVSGNYGVRIGYNAAVSGSTFNNVHFRNFYDGILNVNGEHEVISNVNFFDMWHTGITINNTIHTDYAQGPISNMVFQNVDVTPAAEAAIYAVGGNSNIQISNSDMEAFGNQLKWAFEYSSTTSGGWVSINGVKCEYTSVGCFSFTGYGAQINLTGNMLANSNSNASWTGISVNGNSGSGFSFGTISNNTIQVVAATGYGIRAQGTISNWGIFGNTIDHGAYGMSMEVNLTATTIGQNSITNSATIPIFAYNLGTWLDTATLTYTQITNNGFQYAVNGSRLFCSDCNSTCTGGGSTGRTCVRENGAWTH